MNFDIFLLTFIPIFVSMDVLGMVPLFISLTEKFSTRLKVKLILIAVLTGLILALIIIYFGTQIFNALGITINDFRIAGGIILLGLSLNDLLFSSEKRKSQDDEEINEEETTSLGIVPLGVPLIMGPAVMATLLILIKEYGYPMTIISLILNLLIVLVSLLSSEFIMKVLGKAGTKGVAKVMYLFLAAYAVMMIREGIKQIIISG